MSISLILKMLHVFAAFWFAAGLIGRYVALSKAEQSKDIRSVCTLMPVAGVFERLMVIPGSFAVLVAGLVTAWAQGWPVLGFLQGGTSNWLLVSLILFISLFPVIALIFVPRGKVFDAAFNDAVAKERITPELSAAFRDPTVRSAHYYELAVLVLIVSLMVLKPF